MESEFLLVAICVLGPVAGSLMGVLRRPSEGYICNMLCFAAGVMLAISFLELIPESLAKASVALSAGGLLAGSLAMLALDRIIPHIHPRLCAQEQGCNLERRAIFLILGIFLHNFPEGMAIGLGSFADARVTFTIALAIAIHNIPEGICTSAPYFHATGSRMRAFLLSSSTALPILLGYLLARFLFKGVPDPVVGFLMAVTAGVMVYITADELIPHSCAGKDHKTIFSLMAGIVFVLGLGALE